MRAFIPSLPNSPFAIQEAGQVYVRYMAGPHYPADQKDVESWMAYLESSEDSWMAYLESSEDSDHKAALTSLKAAVEAAEQLRETPATTA